MDPVRQEMIRIVEAAPKPDPKSLEAAPAQEEEKRKDTAPAKPKVVLKGAAAAEPSTKKRRTVGNGRIHLKTSWKEDFPLFWNSARFGKEPDAWPFREDLRPEEEKEMKEVEEEMEALVENYNAYVTEARAALEDLAFKRVNITSRH